MARMDKDVILDKNKWVVVCLDPSGLVTMKRDMDLIRLILREITTRKDLVPRLVKIDGYDDADVARHVYYLQEAKLIKGTDPMRSGRDYSPPVIMVTDLLWDGHEFIANMEAKEVWNVIKNKFSPPELATMSWGVLQFALSETAKYVARTRLGITL